MGLGAPQIVNREAVRPVCLLSDHSGTLAAVVAVGAAIRLYLCFANFCISGDGAAYLGMAKDYAAGNWRAPLTSVFSPLYPLLIAGLHWVVPNWELAGDLVSALMGTAAIGSIYLLTRQMFGRRDLALGAAAFAAIHPDLAAYSASVRTESGYILLTTTATALLFIAVARRRRGFALLCGLVSGLAYLYRTEAIGFLMLNPLFPLAAALLYGDLPLIDGLGLGLLIFLGAMTFAVPYLVLVHAATGVWTISRELTAAIMFTLGSATGDSQKWRELAFSPHASAWSALVRHPMVYVGAIAQDFGASLYAFAQAAGPVIGVLLPVGLWQRGRRIVFSAREAFVSFLILFYFCGFAVTLTGARFMIHLIPYTLGWVVIGLAEITGWFARYGATHGWRSARAIPAFLAAAIMLPQTLWPIGFDMRGVRYAGERIAQLNATHADVAARDGRVAWYAGARAVQLPARAAPPLCDWLRTHADVGYLLLDNHDEALFAARHQACVTLLSRYARYGSGYYDLYAVRREAAS